MLWRNLFNIPKYISQLEFQIDIRNQEDESYRKQIVALQQQVIDFSREIALYRGKIEIIEKYFTSTPDKNDIEDKGVEEIDIDEGFRIPIVEGVKMRFEDEPEDSARPINVYGSKQISTKTN